MPTGAGIKGTLESKNILLGGWRFFIAPFDTYIDETVPFNTVDPPGSFLDMGPCSQDSSLSMSKQYFDYMNGVPLVLKSRKVISIDFVINVALDQFSGANLARSILNTLYAVKKFKSTPAIVLAAAVPSGNVVQMTSSTNWLEGDYVALATSPSGLVNTSDEYRIVEVSGNYLILDRDVATVFASAPYVGDIESWKIPYGSSIVNKAAILGCFDAVQDGVQFVVVIPRAVIDGNWSDGLIPANAHSKVMMTITGQSYYDSDLDDQVVASLLKIAS